MGWATNIQTHSEKALPSVGTTALGLFFVFCFFLQLSVKVKIATE